MPVLPAPDDLTSAESSARVSGLNAAIAGSTIRGIQRLPDVTGGDVEHILAARR